MNSPCREGGLRMFAALCAKVCCADLPTVRCGRSVFAALAKTFGMKGGELMGWMAPASTGVAMRHSAGVKICL